MAIISSGQITIVDQNDAKPITAIISASGPSQQTIVNTNNINSYNPDWVSTPLTLTANIYVGGVNVTGTASVTGRQWSTTFDGSDLGTAVTHSVNTNFTTPTTTASRIYYFKAIYTDPTTSVASRIDAQITVSAVVVGADAVFIRLSGIDVVSQSDTAVKNVALIKAELMRNGAPDTDNLQYRWYSVSNAGVLTKLYSGVAGVANYGVKSTTIANAPTGAASDCGGASFTTAGITTATTGTADADWSTAGNPGYNTLIIAEGAITTLQTFKVEVRDNTNTSKEYSQFFTVYDVSDPYTVPITSDNGDRFLQGVGNTQLRLKVLSGANEISSYTGWTFDWYLRNSLGSRVGFVASTTPPTPDVIRTITANTTTGLTVDSTVTLSAGDLIKMVSADGGTVKFAQVAATTTTAVTLQTASGDNANCNPVTTITASEFVNGKMYKAISKKTTSATGVGIVVTEHDIDKKGTITVDANRP